MPNPSFKRTAFGSRLTQTLEVTCPNIPYAMKMAGPISAHLRNTVFFMGYTSETCCPCTKSHSSLRARRLRAGLANCGLAANPSSTGPARKAAQAGEFKRWAPLDRIGATNS